MGKLHLKSHLRKVGQDKIRNLFRMLKALPFLPPSLVISGLKVLKTASTPAFDPMLNYFEKYYIGQLMDNKVDRKKCNFPISTWSFFERVLTGAQLSNNMIEAWHKPFLNVFNY